MTKNRLCAAMALAFGGSIVATSAFAQQQLERVEITGSAIKRIDAETAVPVTILKIEDLKKQGITTIEQVLDRISAGQISQGTSQSVGSGTGGAAFANLRGLGQNKTLVLLNGRRLANNAIDSTAPDLNMIPFAALERVEVLRDGASALYGTDAVGGVINFITRRDFTGGVLSAGTDKPQKSGGGNAYNTNFAFGVGDVDKDRFNFFGVLDYQKQDRLRASERPDINARSLKTSPTTFPGQYNQGGAVEDPLFPGCGAPNGIPTPDTSNPLDKTCGYLYARQVDLTPNTERMSALFNGTFKFDDSNRANLEYFVARDRNDTLVAGVPYGALAVNPGTAFYPGNGITPLPTAFVLDPAYFPANSPAGTLPGYIKLRWRDQVSGGRAEQTKNTQQRLVASFEGAVAGWDYKAGAAYNDNQIVDNLIGGYTDGTVITPGILNGIINPFGAQTPAGSALIASAAANGTLFTGRGQVYSLDAQASRELGDWAGAGRPAAIAVGAETRHEKFKFAGNPPFDAQVISSTGFDPATNSEGQRNVTAVYTELNIPLLKSLDVTAAVRYDKYSDFGNTTNPKLSFRYQPMQQLLVRGSYSTGFRAPSLFDLNAPNTFTNTASNHDDPVRCPGGVPIAGVSKSDNCQVQFIVLNGGNKALQPEKSRSYTLGLVFEPMADANLGVDFWWIRLKQQIGVLSDDTLFGEPAKYAGLFHRAPDGSLSTDGSQCPGANCGYVLDTSENLGEVHTNGIDLSGNYRLRAGSAGTFNFGFNSTYVLRYDFQNEVGGLFVDNINQYQGNGAITGGGVIFRWQHSVTAQWNLGAWGLGVTGHYKSGYLDQTAPNTVPSYTVFDLNGSWQPTKAILLAAGVRNVFDREPPTSNQAATFQVGYDPRYADAIGRVYYVRGTYSF
jgi:iron complex outermembrane receptor protein